PNLERSASAGLDAFVVHDLKAFGVRAQKANEQVTVGLGPRLLQAGQDAEIGTQHIAGPHQGVKAASLTRAVQRVGRVFEPGTEPARNPSGAIEVHRALCSATPFLARTSRSTKANPVGRGWGLGLVARKARALQSTCMARAH